MSFRGLALSGALAFVLGTAAAGCAALYHGPAGGPQAEVAPPDSASMNILVDNQNDDAVRVFLYRGANAGWIGTVASMTSQAIRIPADLPGGGGGLTIRFQTLSGQVWDARGIVPQGGATVRLDIDRDLKMSTWSMK